MAKISYTQKPVKLGRNKLLSVKKFMIDIKIDEYLEEKSRKYMIQHVLPALQPIIGYIYIKSPNICF